MAQLCGYCARQFVAVEPQYNQVRKTAQLRWDRAGESGVVEDQTPQVREAAELRRQGAGEFVAREGQLP